MYLMIAACSFELSRVSSIMTMFTCLRTIMLDLVFVEVVSISGLTIKGKVVGLVRVVSFCRSLLCSFSFEGSPVCSRAIKSSRVGPELSIAGA